MNRQSSGQTLERAFAATDSYRSLHDQGGFEYPMCNFLGHYIIDADFQKQGPRRRAMLQCFEKVLAEPEDLVRILVNQPPHLGWNESSAGFGKELLTKAIFERT